MLRALDADSVDLIYLDPPFNSNQDYAAPIGSEAAGAAFKDTWTLSDVNEAEHGELADRDACFVCGNSCRGVDAWEKHEVLFDYDGAPNA